MTGARWRHHQFLRSVRSSPHRLRLILVLAAALFLLGSNVAWACLCDPLVPRKAVANAAAVFTGVARGRITPERLGFGERVEFSVETVYKGGVPNRWAVTVEAASCGYVFSDGERYTVFVTADGKTNLCMGNVRGAIDPATYGVQAITAYPVQPVDVDMNTVLALTAIVLVALGAVVVRLRRSRSA